MTTLDQFRVRWIERSKPARAAKREPSPIDLSLELLRTEHPKRYALWVLSAGLASTLAYLASCVAIIADAGWEKLWRVANPYVVIGNLVALLLLRVGYPRVASALLLFGLWADMQASLVTQGGTFVVLGVMIAPVFVLGAGFLLGGRVALVGAAITAVTFPVALFMAKHESDAATPFDPLLLVTVEGSLFGTGVLLVAFLHSFARILQESQTNARRARELIDGAPDAVVALTMQGTIEAFNRAAERLLRVPRAQAIGRRYTSLPLRADAGVWPSDASRLLANSGAIALRVDDAATRLEALVRPTTLFDGTQGVLVMLRDVTERHASEERARELQAQLQQAQKLEAVGLLAGGVAHDFNNLLTAIGGFGSLVARSDDPRMHEFGTEIVAAQQRGAVLVRQLLTFARREAVQLRTFDVSQALLEMIALVERLVGDRVRVRFESGGPSAIRADPGQFEQVIMNLAANARDAMPNGGTLTLSCEADEEQVTVRVQDDGAGIDPQIKARIFEPFFTTKGRSKGTGLGLSMVHGIVSGAGGTIDVESAPGRGTRFSLHWPRHPLPL